MSTSVVHPNVVSISVIIHPHIITQPVVCIQFRLMPCSLHHQPLFSMQVATYHYEIKAVQTISDEGSMQIEGGGQVKKTDWKLFLVQVRCLLGSDSNQLHAKNDVVIALPICRLLSISCRSYASHRWLMPWMLTFFMTRTQRNRTWWDLSGSGCIMSEIRCIGLVIGKYHTFHQLNPIHSFHPSRPWSCMFCLEWQKA